MATDKITALIQRIAKHAQRVTELDAILAEDGATLTDEQLDQITAERTTAQARLDALQAALAAEKGKGDAAISEAAQQAKKDAHKACAKAALERADAAADIDNAIVALIAGIQRYDILCHAMRRGAVGAGLGGIRNSNMRGFSTDLRPIGAVLAARLSSTHLVPKLDFIQVVGSQHTTQTVAEMTAAANGKLLRGIERSIQS